MQDISVIRVNRRKLLMGISALVLAGAFAPRAEFASDRIIIRSGWILKESDLT